MTVIDLAARRRLKRQTELLSSLRNGVAHIEGEPMSFVLGEGVTQTKTGPFSSVLTKAGSPPVHITSKLGDKITSERGPVKHRANSRRFACFCGRLCVWAATANEMRCACGARHVRSLRA